jgi:phosphoglycolate phosphatase-like HAD superfamily hydrolase
VGDVVDDIEAARSAGRKTPVVPIGFVFRSGKQKSLAESLRTAGAYVVIQRPDDLLKLIS